MRGPISFKVQYLHGECVRRYGRQKREGGCALAGEICLSEIWLLMLRDIGMDKQKSDEVIVDRIDPIEGPNVL